tara:strand:+ start:13659 stop:13766 length:108 start_codon:yes stop_codon:yes gene_type:complete
MRNANKNRVDEALLALFVTIERTDREQRNRGGMIE